MTIIIDFAYTYKTLVLYNKSNDDLLQTENDDPFIKQSTLVRNDIEID